MSFYFIVASYRGWVNSLEYKRKRKQIKLRALLSPNVIIFLCFRLTYLLTSKNQLLTPKLLLLITNKWKQIMAIIKNQLRKDKQEKLRQNNGSQNETKQLPLSEDEQKALNEQKQKKGVTIIKETKQSEKKQCWCQCHFEKQENSNQIEFNDEAYQFMKNQRVNDHDLILFNTAEKKNLYKKKQERYQLFCCPCHSKKQKTEQKSGEIQQKPMDLKEKYQHTYEDSYAIRVSEKAWNYRQKFTLKRKNVQKGKKIKKTQKAQKAQKEQKAQKAQKDQMSNKQAIKGEQKIDYKKTQHGFSTVSKQLKDQFVDEVLMHDEEKSMMGREMRHPQGLDSNEESFYISENSAAEQMGTQNQRSSENIQMLENEVMNMHVESENVQTVSNQVENTQPQQQQSTTTNNKAKPKESVKHRNREIDYLVYSVITNREFVIETIVNHIYYELLVWNVTLRPPQPDEPTEKKDSFSKNLFNQQQK